MPFSGAIQAVFVSSAVPTQLDKFKVAFSEGSSPNWFCEWNAGSANFYESGAGRFAVPVWKDPARYAENSPIAYVDRINTPVLYFSGGPQQYMALASLGRNAVNISGRNSDQEQRQRVLFWLKEHFFGDKPTIQHADLPEQFFQQ